jgi:hypothetical protein
VGIVSYAAAAVLGWYLSPLLSGLIFIGMVVYHAWTSQGTRS